MQKVTALSCYAFHDSGSFLAAFAPKVQAAEPRVDNPFVGATAYINPDYAALIDTSIAQTSDSDLVENGNGQILSNSRLA